MMDLELPPPGLQSQQSDYCPLGGLLCIQMRRYKFWKKFFEHVESM
ncbi:nuclear factor erythroid 2-related factor 2 isoform X4 [Apodemus sylvaticus]|nr:nuclear factor erythroid 2-related factor 2 isoform X4 [Apodemus sylvaticus]